MKNNYRNKLKDFGKIYFYCCDPGSFYAAEPIFDDMKGLGKKTVWLFDGWCAENKKNITSAITVDVFMKNINDVSAENSCVIVGSQVNYKLNHSMIDFFKNKSFHTVFLFDYWGNYLENFQDKDNQALHLTDCVFVMDELARTELIKALTPVVHDKTFFDNIILAGHQGIEKTIQSIKKVKEELIIEFRQQVNPSNKKLILFVLEPLEEDFGYLNDGTPYLGFNEYIALKHFFTTMTDYIGAKILIKPHPRHRSGIIQDFLAKNISSQNIDYSIIDNIDINLLLRSVDEVIGMTSTLLVIALKCGKEIRSIQVGRNENARKKVSPYLNPYIIE